MKKDEQGNIRLYDRKDPATGETKKVAILTYIEDMHTGEIYLDEPAYIVSVKSALIALGLPFYTFGRMVMIAIKTPIEITTIALETLYKLGQQLCRCQWNEASAEVMRGVAQSGNLLGNALYEIVKAPLFMLGCELAAIYGIFKPYHGRKYEAMIERAWQQGSSYKKDCRNISARPGENCWEACVKDLRASDTQYLGLCYQVRGNVSSPLITVIKRESASGWGF
jgi:hypothetical protein